MTVVLITGNFINQFKCLITTASRSPEHKGSCLDVDEFQKEMGEEKPTVSTSPWKHGGGGSPGRGRGESRGPHRPQAGPLREDCGLTQVWNSLWNFLNPRVPGVYLLVG